MATADQLRSAINDLSEKDRSFANSLLEGFNKYGSFTFKQQRWVDILVERSQEAEPQDVKLGGTLNPMGAMIRLFQAGKSHLKFPKVRLLTEGQKNLYLTLAGEKSKYRGQIMVADQDVYDDAPWGSARRFYGRVDKDGTFHASRKCDQDVIDALEVFAKDPVQAATAYGRLTGNCCFCKQRLTDERSYKVGYGQTCAGHYGLPWGEK